MPRGLALLTVLACALASGHAQDGPCSIRSGEVVGIRDPRLHDPSCFIETGVTIRLYVEEVESKVVRARIERHPACKPSPSEVALMDDLSTQARDYLLDKSVKDVIIDVVEAPCAPERGVDLIIVEVR